MSTDIKRLLSIKNKSGGFLGKTFGNMMSNFGKKALTDFPVPLVEMFCLN